MADFLKYLISNRFEDAQVINALASTSSLVLYKFRKIISLILEFYEALISESSSLGITADRVATMIIPSFAPLIAASGLNQQQVGAIFEKLHF